MVSGTDRGTGAPPPPPRPVPRKRSKALEQAELSQHKQAVQLPDGTKNVRTSATETWRTKKGGEGNCDNSGQNKNKRERVQNMKDIQQAQSRQRIDHSFSRLKGKGRKCLFQCSLQLVAHRQTDTWLTIKAHFCHSELSSQ